MAPGLAFVGAAITTDSTERVWAYGLCGTVLLFGGYLAPVLKRIAFKVPGGGFEAELRKREELTESDVELSTELDEAQPIEIAPAEVDVAARFFAASVALEGLLRPTGELEGCSLHLYLYNERLGGLVAHHEFEDDDRIRVDKPWAPGVGVTGTAYSTGELQVAVGPATRDDTFNLSSEQQERHSRSGLSAVAAVPVTNGADRIIAVLAASEHRVPVDQARLGARSAQDQLIALSEPVARVLIDLLGWFSDDP